jgi:hypothetical protein
MAERKPQGVNFETWIDRQVREAMDRGEFDNLPGAGKPIRGIDDPYDEMWWVKEKLRRENVSVLPASLALRKDAEDALSAAARARSASEARRIITDINERIRDAFRRPLAGPPLNLVPFDVERVVDQWRRNHPSDLGRFGDCPAWDDKSGDTKAGADRRRSERVSRWRRFTRRHLA